MADILIGTGLEDALSLTKLGRSERVIGVPGDGTLQNLTFARGTRANVVRDGDKNGSAADQAIVAGIDALLIQKVDAYITPTPEGEDANSIWQKQGAEGLATLVDSAAPVELSKPWGIIKYLATLDRPQYEAERARMAKHIGWRVSVLDDEVAQLRDAKRFHVEDADNDEGGDGDDGELAVKVDLAELLDRMSRSSTGTSSLPMMCTRQSHCGRHTRTSCTIRWSSSPYLRVSRSRPKMRVRGRQ